MILRMQSTKQSSLQSQRNETVNQLQKAKCLKLPAFCLDKIKIVMSSISLAQPQKISKCINCRTHTCIIYSAKVSKTDILKIGNFCTHFYEIVIFGNSLAKSHNQFTIIFSKTKCFYCQV